MDPYLEDPGLWPDVHLRLINAASELLSAALRPHYTARVEERVHISREDDTGRRVLVPDVLVEARPGVWPNLKSPSSSVAVAEPVEITLTDPEIHEYRIEFVDRHNRAVVAVIEFLSPVNKIDRADGRQSFLSKGDQVYESCAAWIEVDLLRTGATTFARWGDTLSHYGVDLSRPVDEPRRQSLLWLIQRAQRLPKIPIPLKPGDGDAKLDLQEALDLAYDRGVYDVDIDYTKEPRIALDDNDRRWARALLDARRDAAQS